MKHKSFFIFILGLLFILNLVGYSFVQYQMANAKNFELTNDNLAEKVEDSKVNITLVRSKDWPEGKFYHGVQYDAVLINDTNHQMSDWTVTLTLPENSEITDSWNISYSVTDGVLTARPVDYNMIVEPYNQQTFGFIVKSKNIEEITSAYVRFVPIYQYTDYPLFWANIAFSFILFLTVLITIIVELRTSTLRSQNIEDKHIIVQTMKTFSNFIDTKDPYTRGHSVRVAYYSRELAKKLRLPERDVELIYYIALLHDIGKTLIPDAILNKPGKLTPEERSVIETHTSKGAMILKDFDAIEGIADGAGYHHEHYDGSGYPNKLKGEDIPFLARIICVADSYDAMSSDRCYRKRLSNDVIISELTTNSGKQFDPEVVDAMLSLLETTNFFSEMDE